MAITRLNNSAVSAVSSLPNLASLPSAIDVGKVGQVVSSTLTSHPSTTSTSFTNTGLTATITPSSTSSKILILVNTGGGISDGGYRVMFRLDGTVGTSVGNAGNNAVQTSGATGDRGADSYTYQSVSFSFLDSPNTTSAKTYNVQFLTTNGNATVYMNRSHSQDENTNSSISTITLTEILA